MTIANGTSPMFAPNLNGASTVPKANTAAVVASVKQSRKLMQARETAGTNNMTEIEGHAEVVEDTLDTRIHDNKKVLRCTRCNNIMPRDEPERFANVDCDQYKELSDRISGEL